MTFEEYCRAVSAHIRFKPDRGAVEAELLAHLEDRREALAARGVPEEEAEARAVAAMGDPAETGKALDKCHSPWLGWAYVVVHRLAWTLGVITLLTVLLGLGAQANQLSQFDLLPDAAACMAASGGRAAELTGDAAPLELAAGGETRAGRYTYGVAQASLYEGEAEDMAAVLLRESWADPRLGSSYAVPRFEVDGAPVQRESEGWYRENAVLGGADAVLLRVTKGARTLTVRFVTGEDERELAAFSIALRGGGGG